MAETEAPVVEEKAPETPVFSFEGKPEPTVIVAETTDPVIKEKDEHIKEDKPEITKPGEGDRTPGANPPPIQDKPDEDKKDIKPADAVAPEPIKFANEESEKVFNLLKEGKTDEVLTIYQEQKKLATADKLAPADAIKLNLQYQNKEFTPAEINDLFDEQYEFPEKPVKGELDDDDEFKILEDKYNEKVKKIEARIARDAKPAIAELQKLSKEIVLPDLPKSEVQAKEPTQEELEGQKQAKELFFKDVEENAKKFNGYSTTFKDEEVEIKALFPVTDEDRKSVNPLLDALYTDIPKFLTELGWADKDGKITPKIIEDLHLIQNKSTVFSKLAEQVGTQRHAEHIKSQKNIDYSGNKKSSNPDLGATPIEAQKNMANHFFSAV